MVTKVGTVPNVSQTAGVVLEPHEPVLIKIEVFVKSLVELGFLQGTPADEGLCE